MLADAARRAPPIVQNRQYLLIQFDRFRHQQNERHVQRTLGQIRATNLLNRQVETTAEPSAQFRIIEFFQFLGGQVLSHRLQQPPGRQLPGQFPFPILKKQGMGLEVAVNLVHFRQEPDGLPSRVPDAEPDTLARNQIAGRGVPHSRFRLERHGGVFPMQFHLHNRPSPSQGQFRGLEQRVVGIKQILLADLLAQARTGQKPLETLFNPTGHQINVPRPQVLPEVLDNGHGRTAHRPQPLHAQNHHPRLRTERLLQLQVQVFHRGEMQIPFDVDQHDGRRQRLIERHLLETPRPAWHQQGQVRTTRHPQQEDDRKENPHKNRVLQRQNQRRRQGGQKNRTRLPPRLHHQRQPPPVRQTERHHQNHPRQAGLGNVIQHRRANQQHPQREYARQNGRHPRLAPGLETHRRAGERSRRLETLKERAQKTRDPLAHKVPREIHPLPRTHRHRPRRRGSLDQPHERQRHGPRSQRLHQTPVEMPRLEQLGYAKQVRQRQVDRLHIAQQRHTPPVTRIPQPPRIRHSRRQHQPQQRAGDVPVDTAHEHNHQGRQHPDPHRRRVRARQRMIRLKEHAEKRVRGSVGQIQPQKILQLAGGNQRSGTRHEAHQHRVRHIPDHGAETQEPEHQFGDPGDKRQQQNELERVVPTHERRRHGKQDQAARIRRPGHQMARTPAQGSKNGTENRSIETIDRRQAGQHGKSHRLRDAQNRHSETRHRVIAKGGLQILGNGGQKRPFARDTLGGRWRIGIGHTGKQTCSQDTD